MSYLKRNKQVVVQVAEESCEGKVGMPLKSAGIAVNKAIGKFTFIYDVDNITEIRLFRGTPKLDAAIGVLRLNITYDLIFRSQLILGYRPHFRYKEPVHLMAQGGQGTRKAYYKK